MEMRPSLKLEVHFGIADLDFLGLVGGLEFSQKILEHQDAFVHASLPICLQENRKHSISRCSAIDSLVRAMYSP